MVPSWVPADGAVRYVLRASNTNVLAEMATMIPLPKVSQFTVQSNAFAELI